MHGFGDKNERKLTKRVKMAEKWVRFILLKLVRLTQTTA